MTPYPPEFNVPIPRWMRITLTVVGASAFIAALIIAYKMEGHDPSGLLSTLTLGIVGVNLFSIGMYKSTAVHAVKARRKSAKSKQPSRLWGLANVAAGLFLGWYAFDLLFRMIDSEFADRPVDMYCALVLMLVLGAGTYGYIAHGAKRLMAPKLSTPDMPTTV
ncbi:MAG TPA: hypothetical protein VK694_01595 [Verrucomicrobiae bacterium]|nr:hypothetical protein [Verrucomicrobiae bacterium]